MNTTKAINYPPVGSGREVTHTPSFDPILDDYNFFEQHATEMQVDLRWYKDQLQGIDAEARRLRMLDFGAGTGSFTRELLWCTDLHHRVRLDLTLVEPGHMARRRAWDCLRTFTGRRMEIYPEMSQDQIIPFDLIMANHSLYFVADLARTVDDLMENLAEGGRMLIAMSDSDNFLIRCWDLGFGSIGESTPFYRAEDLEDCLASKGVSFRREKLDYSIRFPDSVENRRKILRFLFGEQLRRIPESHLLDFFNPYAEGGEIVIDTAHCCYRI